MRKWSWSIFNPSVPFYRPLLPREIDYGLSVKYLVVTNINDIDLDQLVWLYANEFWCSKRKRSDVEIMLKNTDIVVGVKTEMNELVGFARVLTDFVYKATIYDLIVHPEWRSNKIGKLLMDTVLNHQELNDIGHFDLNCLPEMYSYYEQWGFTTDVGELGFMRKFNKKNETKAYK